LNFDIQGIESTAKRCIRHGIPQGTPKGRAARKVALAPRWPSPSNGPHGLRGPLRATFRGARGWTFGFGLEEDSQARTQQVGVGPGKEQGNTKAVVGHVIAI